MAGREATESEADELLDNVGSRRDIVVRQRSTVKNAGGTKTASPM
jgi:hypothetical protein